MFRPAAPTSSVRSAFATLELIFHVAVRNVRKSHGNAVLGLLVTSCSRPLMLVIIYFMFNVLRHARHRRCAAISCCT